MRQNRSSNRRRRC